MTLPIWTAAPVLGLVLWTYLVYFLGKEAGRDEERKATAKRLAAANKAQR